MTVLPVKIKNKPFSFILSRQEQNSDGGCRRHLDILALYLTRKLNIKMCNVCFILFARVNHL